MRVQVHLFVRTESQAGPVTSVDDSMIAYGSQVSMHKGKITMLGRIMAGSHAVINAFLGADGEGECTPQPITAIAKTVILREQI